VRSPLIRLHLFAADEELTPHNEDASVRRGVVPRGSLQLHWISRERRLRLRRDTPTHRMVVVWGNSSWLRLMLVSPVHVCPRRLREESRIDNMCTCDWREHDFDRTRCETNECTQGGGVLGGDPQRMPPACVAGGSAPSLARDLPSQVSNLVDSASSHTLVSKIKPCMSKYK
jgi:hypothetical protein